MDIIRTKNYVPQNYISESRDFQLFTRVLDFVQNSIKFNIDNITNIIDTDNIPDIYVDRLKSKIGFFTSNYYNNTVLRKVLSAFPYILKYKGSEAGIERCVNTFLNIIGIKEGSRIDIYNNHAECPYVVRIGISTAIMDTTILKDMLSYVLPTGYFIEIYFYDDYNLPHTESILETKLISLNPGETKNTTIRSSNISDTTKDNTYNTLYLSTIYDPTNRGNHENEEGAKNVYEG